MSFHDLPGDHKAAPARVSIGWLNKIRRWCVSRNPEKSSEIVPKIGLAGTTFELSSSVRRQLRGAGGAAGWHPWKLVDASEDSFQGRLVRVALRTSSDLTAAVVENVGPFDLPPLAKCWLAIELGSTGTITSRKVVVADAWWDGYPKPYKMTPLPPDSEYQSSAFVPVFELVAEVGDLDSITDGTSDPVVTYGVKQSVTTALELMDLEVDGKAIRLPEPSPGAQ
jgi:hypothetical protein